LGLLSADLAQIEQVITNMVLCVQETMTKNGRLTIATRNHTVRSNNRAIDAIPAPGPHVTLVVTDSDTSIDGALFDEMLDSDPETRASDAEAGIALEAVHALMEQSNGALATANARGRGATLAAFWPQSTTTSARHSRQPTGPCLPMPSTSPCSTTT